MEGVSPQLRRADSVSKVSFLSGNTKSMVQSYNLVNTLPKQLLRKIKSDGEVLMNAPKFCESLWREFRKTDPTSNGIFTLKIIDIIFQQFEDQIVEILGIHSAAEFFETFDYDGDGYMNEDDQILVLSVIKAKMQQTAKALCKIQEYEAYRDLMKALRSLEKNIGVYQNEVRGRIYRQELQNYHDIGTEKLEAFYDRYIKEFDKLDGYMLDRKQQLAAQQEDESAKLNERLNKGMEALRIKPKKKLKEYQTQEILVAIGERVEEAQNFRRELKVLEEKERDRVNSMREHFILNKQKELEDKHSKDTKLLDLKLQNMENKLKIAMSREYQVLEKQTRLHENEIKRLQHSATNIAMKKALNEGELARMKDKARDQNKILEQTKQVGKKEDLLSPEPEENLHRVGTSGRTTKTEIGKYMEGYNSRYGSIGGGSQDYGFRSMTNMNVTKFMKPGMVTHFYLRQKFGSDLPVNARDNVFKEAGDQHYKIERFLVSNKTSARDVLPKLTELYDPNLNPCSPNERTRELNTREKVDRRHCLDERIGLDYLRPKTTAVPFGKS